MNIAVYCGAAKGNDTIYEKTAKIVGKWIAKSGHTLVYGGGDVGLMGIVANTVLENGGEVIGVIPDILMIREQRHNGLTKTIDTKSMSERRDIMMELSEAFIALPGGPGTLDEISEIIMMMRIREMDSPCVLFNTEGFYNPLKALIQNMVNAAFSERQDLDRLLFSDNIKEIAEYIENFEPRK